MRLKWRWLNCKSLSTALRSTLFRRTGKSLFDKIEEGKVKERDEKVDKTGGVAYIRDANLGVLICSDCFFFWLAF